MEDPNLIDPDLCLDPSDAESYQCIVCLSIPLNQQYSCSKCKKILCFKCMSDLKNKCPYKCENSTFQPIQQIKKAKIESLKLKCKKCFQIFAIMNYENHKPNCGKNKCSFRICPNIIDKNIKKYNLLINGNQIYFCSKECKFAYKLAIQDFSNNSIESGKKLISAIDEIALDEELHFKCKEINELNLEKDIPYEDNLLVGMESNNGVCNFRWDSNSSKAIILSNGNKSAFLKESGYSFRSIVSDRYFQKGIFYWEIIPDIRTENQLKVGVALSNSFDRNTSFSDNEFGYAFYGLGQLRHGCNSDDGMKYGLEFKNTGTLGVCLNMKAGTLSFALNTKFLGNAFSDEKLKKGPIYAAISLLHCAGLTLITGKPVPNWFK